LVQKDPVRSTAALNGGDRHWNVSPKRSLLWNILANGEKCEDGNPALAGGSGISKATRQQSIGWRMASNPSQLTVPILCPVCNQLGAVVLEEGDGLAHGPNPKPRLVRVAGAFHVERAATQSDDPIIVCDECDTIQGD
jgi:hypothetical protein